MALSNSQLADIRRHLSVPFAGVPDSRFTAGIRTLLRVGQLEFYVQVLQIEEEAILTGYPYAYLRIAGKPQVGQTLSVVINGGSPITYTVSPADLVTVDSTDTSTPLKSVAAGLALNINLAGIAQLAAAAAVTYRAAPPATTPNIGILTLLSQTAFTVTASVTAGTGIGIIVDPAANGANYPWPRLTPDVPAGQTQVTYYGYINICNFLESAIASSTDNMSLKSAGGLSPQAAAVFAQDEVAKRAKLYDYFRRQLGNSLSVGMDPAGRGGMGSGLGITV